MVTNHFNSTFNVFRKEELTENIQHGQSQLYNSIINISNNTISSKFVGKKMSRQLYKTKQKNELHSETVYVKHILIT